MQHFNVSNYFVETNATKQLIKYLISSIARFNKLWYAYHQWYASRCSVVHGLSKKKSDDKNKKSCNKFSNIENLIKLLFI
jgi:hypothetical protein